MTRTTVKSMGIRAQQHDRHLARNGRSNSQKKDGFKLWGDISHHHQHLDPEDIAPPAQDDNAADWDDVEEGDEDGDELDAEERADAREDAKVDKVWLATLDVYLAMIATAAEKEEREEAMSVRQAFSAKAKKGTQPITLADIARTSVAAQTMPSSSPETPSSLSASYFSANSDTSSFGGRK